MVWHQSNVSPRPPWPSGPGAESNQQTLGNGAYLRVTRGYDASPLRSEATQTRLKRTTPNHEAKIKIMAETDSSEVSRGVRSTAVVHRVPGAGSGYQRRSWHERDGYGHERASHHHASQHR